MPFDRQRFRIAEQKLFGPFYSVQVFDTLAGRRVPLARGGVLLFGHASVERAVKYGIARYLREQGNGAPLP